MRQYTSSWLYVFIYSQKLPVLMPNAGFVFDSERPYCYNPRRLAPIAISSHFIPFPAIIPEGEG